MSYEQYWNESPSLAIAYRKAHELYIEQRNQEMYIQGLYNFKAFKAVIDWFAYGLNGGKGKKPDSYLEYPLAITEHEKEEEHRRNVQKTIEWFENHE